MGSMPEPAKAPARRAFNQASAFAENLKVTDLICCFNGGLAARLAEEQSCTSRITRPREEDGSDGGNERLPS